MFSLYFYDYKVRYHFKPQHIISSVLLLLVYTVAILSFF